MLIVFVFLFYTLTFDRLLSLSLESQLGAIGIFGGDTDLPLASDLSCELKWRDTCVESHSERLYQYQLIKKLFNSNSITDSPYPVVGLQCHNIAQCYQLSDFKKKYQTKMSVDVLGHYIGCSVDSLEEEDLDNFDALVLLSPCHLGVNLVHTAIFYEGLVIEKMGGGAGKFGVFSFEQFKKSLLLERAFSFSSGMVHNREYYLSIKEPFLENWSPDDQIRYDVELSFIRFNYDRMNQLLQNYLSQLNQHMIQQQLVVGEDLGWRCVLEDNFLIFLFPEFTDFLKEERLKVQMDQSMEKSNSLRGVHRDDEELQTMFLLNKQVSQIKESQFLNDMRISISV